MAFWRGPDKSGDSRYRVSRRGNPFGVLEDVADDADLVAAHLDHGRLVYMVGEYVVPVLDHVARQHLSHLGMNLSGIVLR